MSDEYIDEVVAILHDAGRTVLADHVRDMALENIEQARLLGLSAEAELRLRKQLDGCTVGHESLREICAEQTRLIEELRTDIDNMRQLRRRAVVDDDDDDQTCSACGNIHDTLTPCEEVRRGKHND